jgi:murein tripeptide amidase MpaA
MFKLKIINQQQYLFLVQHTDAQGLLAFLLGSDPRAASLRSAITWVVVPMLNPDGVFLGNYR